MLIPLTDAIARAEGDVATALAACGVKEYAAALGQRPEEHRAAVDALAAAYSRLSNLEALSRRLRVTDVADQHASAAQRIAGHSAANRWVERRAERDAVSRMVPTRENVLQIEILVRFFKYAFEGTIVATAAYFIPNRTLVPEEILIIALIAAATFAVLDLFAPSIGSSVRTGAGFGIGANLVGFPGGAPGTPFSVR